MNRRQQTAKDIDFDGLGDKLREIRQSTGMSIGELARRSRVPPSTISKIENSQINPSLVHAINLATALNANLGFLVDRDAGRSEPFSVVRSGKSASMALPESAMTIHDLNGDFEPNVLEARMGEIEAGGTSGDEPMQHEGEEICHVLSGAIRYRIGGRTIDLAAGDTLHFECTDPHSWENISQTTTSVLWVFSKGLSF